MFRKFIKPSKSKKVLILAGIFIVLILAVMIMVANKPKIKSVEVKPKTWMVEAIAVKIERLSPVFPLVGKVESNNLVTASSPIASVIENVWVREGDYFEKGQKLIALSEQDLQIPVAIAEANLKDSEAKLALLKINFETNERTLEHELALLALKEKNVLRNQRLNKKNLSSEITLDNAKEALVRQQKSVAIAQRIVTEHDLKLAQLEAGIKKAKANLQQAKINLTRGELVAPFSGRVAKVMISVGDRVNPGTAMIRFYESASLELRAKIPNVHLPAIYQSLDKQQPLFASFSIENKVYSLPLSRLASETSATGLDAFLAVPQAIENITLGRLMQVNLKSAPLSNIFALPFSALYGTDKIYKVDQQTSQLVGVKVKKIGETEQKQVLLAGDVQAGDMIVTTHLPNAIGGLSVAVK